MHKIRSYIPVIIAIIIFTLSQVLIVRQVWKQKDEVFKLKYRAVAREATGELMMKTGDSGFDKAYYVMDGVSEIYMEKSKILSTPEDSASFTVKVIKDLTGILEKDQILSKYISNAFGRLSLEKKFSSRVIINELYLLGPDRKYRVYTSSPSELKHNGSEDLILVNNFISEGNNFKISFDYFIDIANKRKVLLREISLTLLLSILSLAILASIFIGTLRNYMREKRMSDLKTDFINNMTHELKTPLSTITVAGKTLKLEEILNDREKILATASLIGKQSVHLNKLINLILEISMWERSQFEVDRKKTNMEELLSEIGDSFRNGCGSDCTFIEEYNLNGVEADVDIVYFTMMVKK
ncbi:MAG: histidine kinase dimerization/phospho-acceptor domain-containing protein [Bacteroidales bacterium]